MFTNNDDNSSGNEEIKTYTYNYKTYKYVYYTERGSNVEVWRDDQGRDSSATISQEVLDEYARIYTTLNGNHNYIQSVIERIADPSKCEVNPSDPLDDCSGWDGAAGGEGTLYAYAKDDTGATMTVRVDVAKQSIADIYNSPTKGEDFVFAVM